MFTPLIQPWIIKLILLTQMITTWEISTTIDINILNMYWYQYVDTLGHAINSKKKENVFQLISQTCKLKLGEG